MDLPASSPTRMRRLMVYFLRYRWHFLFGSLLLVATTYTALSIPRQLGSAIGLMREGMAEGATVDIASVRAHALTIAGLAVVACLVRIASRMLLFFAGRLIEYDVRNELFEKLTVLEVDWHHRQSTGDLVSRIINDVNNVRAMYGFGTLSLVNTALTYVMVLSFMFAVSPQMTWLSLMPYPVIILVMRFFSRALFVRTQESQAQLSEISSQAQEALSGVQVVRSFAIEDQINERFVGASDEYVRRNLRLAVVRGALDPFIASIGSIGGLIVLWFGGRFVVQGGLTIGQYVEFSAYITALAWPTASLGFAITMWQRGIASFDRILLILGTTPEVREPSAEARARHPRDEAKRLTGDIVFDDVSLQWDDGSTALEGINVCLPAGKITAIVGRTGSGKTTLVELIARLRDPTKGEVRIGGRPLPAIPIDELRSAIGYVPQDPFLFSRSVRANIELGKHAREEEGREFQSAISLEDAVRIANLDEAVETFEDGLNTLVGERGITLSGGQKQRVTLARALLLDPDILILDDALASVDTRTEHAILEALATVMQGRTTILVTHRFNALALADQILVLEEGRVVEEGSYEALIARGGIFAEMNERQRLQEELAQ